MKSVHGISREATGMQPERAVKQKNLKSTTTTTTTTTTMTIKNPKTAKNTPPHETNKACARAEEAEIGLPEAMC
jgi:hypothetical protein